MVGFPIVSCFGCDFYDSRFSLLFGCFLLSSFGDPLREFKFNQSFGS